MVRFVSLIVALLLLPYVPAAWAQKDVRVALVIGNGAYQNAEPLRNPVNDARAMARALRDAGFEVIAHENLTRRGFVEALHEFSGKVPPGGVGLFYYAGHGIQVRGLNHLVPVDAALTTERDVKYETIDLNDVLGGLNEARARLSLVILDACRDNPFARRFRSTTRGLAQTDAPRGTMIAYATAPGETAADGDGNNGLYTAELLKAIAVPGLKLEEIFKRTIDGVARASGNKQTPWVSSSFRGDFVFNAAVNIPPPAPPPPVTAVPAPPSVDPVEQTAWTTIAGSSNPVMFELFLKRFPNGAYSDFARARLEELKAAASAADEQAKARAVVEEAKRVAAADEARRKADADAAKEAAKRLAAAEEAKRKPDADAKRAADEEAKRAAAAEEARRRAAAEEEKKSVENVEAALKLADVDRKRIQAALTAKGFDTLGTDGSFGPRTRQMIGNWQRSRNEPGTGFLTATQAALLSQDGQSALAKIEDERKKADEDKRKADAERAKAEADRAKAAPPPPQQATAPAPVAPPPAAPAAAGSRDGAWRVSITGSCSEVSLSSFTVKGSQVTTYVSLGNVKGANVSTAGRNLVVQVSGALSPDGGFTLTYSDTFSMSGTISPSAVSGTVSLPQLNQRCPVVGVRR